MDDRDYWIHIALKVATPVFTHLAADTLKVTMPVETNTGNDTHLQERSKTSHLEALGRSLAGIGPWLELSNCEGDERQQQEHLKKICIVKQKKK